MVSPLAPRVTLVELSSDWTWDFGLNLGLPKIVSAKLNKKDPYDGTQSPARVGMTSLGGAGGGQMLTALTFSDCSVLSLSAWAASVS